MVDISRGMYSIYKTIAKPAPNAYLIEFNKYSNHRSISAQVLYETRKKFSCPDRSIDQETQPWPISYMERGLLKSL